MSRNIYFEERKELEEASGIVQKYKAEKEKERKKARLRQRYDWLVGKLLESDDKKLYHKAIVDFAEVAFLEADGGVDLSERNYGYGQPSLVGYVLGLTATTKEKVEYSTRALEVAAYLWGMNEDLEDAIGVIMSTLDLTDREVRAGMKADREARRAARKRKRRPKAS